MAGTNSGFDGNAFRTGIRFAMTLGAPPESDEQVAFYFPTQLVYNRPVDAEDTPFDPDATVTRTQPPPVRVPCAVEYRTADGEPAPFGDLTPAHAAIVLLDEDFVQVDGCAYAVLRGEKYIYRSTDFPSGLFDVGVYTMHFIAEDVT